MSVRLRSGVVMQRLAAEAVLLDTTQASYFELNPTGVVVLEHLLGGGSTASATHEVCQQYEIDPASATRDIVQLLGELTRSGLIEID